MDSSVNNQKQDMVNILKFSAQYDMSKSGNVIRVARHIQANNMMTSAIGRQYQQRLIAISNSSDKKDHTCLFCKTSKAEDGILCENCMSKYTGGRLKFKHDTAPISTQSKPSDNLVPVTQTVKTGSEISDIASKTIGKFANKVDELAGGEGKAELDIRVLFSAVFKKHTSDEAERIFICGTKTTTPPIKDIQTNWPAPWLYSRVALGLLLAFVILEVAWNLTGNTNLLPGMMFVGSCIVPLSVVIFFFETNVPQNISIFRAVQVFFIGGCASLLSTLIIFMIVPVGDLNFIGAILVGIIEEVGKMIIVALFIKRMRDCIYVLNGLLIGGAVGAGFAVFESAGYAFRILLSEGYESMVSNINMRAVMSPGGHVAWAAITGAAIMLALSGKKFTWDVLKNGKFLRLFVIPIILHSVWDMPIGIMLIYPVLILAAWITLLVLIQNGLKEINRFSL
ncbi:MAG: PrsW family intramembrane metalloprotease [Lachnospiraceae bacterium]|nr:PrsW family intramembrane metalloprotease [Lachnospiraceae bacterium]